MTVEKGELATSVKGEKKVKTKFIDLDHAGNGKLLAFVLVNVGKKVLCLQCWFKS